MEAPDMAYCVTMKDALRCVKSPMTRSAGQGLVKSLIAKGELSTRSALAPNPDSLLLKQGWLTLHPSQHLTLSTRALAELGTYLRETFDEEGQIVDCNSCLGIVTSVSFVSCLLGGK